MRWRRRTGGEHHATRQRQPTRNDSKRQGRRPHLSVVAGQGMTVLVFTRQWPPPAKASSSRTGPVRGQQHQWDLAAGLVLIGAVALVHLHKAGEQPAPL